MSAEKYTKKSVLLALRETIEDPKTIRLVLERLNALEEVQAPEEKEPPVKKQFVVLVSDPEGRIPRFDFVAWVLQMPETEGVASTLDRLHKATYDYNASKKGRLYPAKTVGDAIENVPAKFFKEAELWVKTKEPVLVIRTNNEIPKDSAE